MEVLHLQGFQKNFRVHFQDYLRPKTNMFADHQPTVQLVDFAKGERNDSLTIIVRSTLTQNGAAPGRVANLG